MQARARLVTPRFLTVVQASKGVLQDAKGRRFLFSEECATKGLIEASYHPDGKHSPPYVGEQVQFVTGRQTFRLVVSEVIETALAGIYVSMRFPACDRN